jgi:hypothetical protein
MTVVIDHARIIALSVNSEVICGALALFFTLRLAMISSIWQQSHHPGQGKKAPSPPQGEGVGGEARRLRGARHSRFSVHVNVAYRFSDRAAPVAEAAAPCATNPPMRGETETFPLSIQLDDWQAVDAESGGDFAAVVDVMFERTPDDRLERNRGSFFSSQTRRVQPHLGVWLERRRYPFRLRERERLRAAPAYSWVNSFQWPSEMTSTAPSTTLMAV